MWRAEENAWDADGEAPRRTVRRRTTESQQPAAANFGGGAAAGAHAANYGTGPHPFPIGRFGAEPGGGRGDAAAAAAAAPRWGPVGRSGSAVNEPPPSYRGTSAGSDPLAPPRGFQLPAGAYANALYGGADEQGGLSPPRRPQVIMAALYQSSSLGLAVYDTLSNEMSVLQCPDEVRGPLAFQMLQLAKLQVEPQIVVLSARTEEEALQAARAPVGAAAASADYDNEAGGDGDGGGGGGGVLEVRLESSAAFVYDKALRRLEQLQVIHTAAAPGGDGPGGTSGGGAGRRGTQTQPGGGPGPGPGPSSQAGAAAGGASAPQCVLHVAGLLDLGQRQAVGALGALVGFVLREGLGPQGPELYGGGGGGGGAGPSALRGVHLRPDLMDLDPDMDPEYGTQRGRPGAAAPGPGVLVVERLSQLAVQGLLQVDLPTLYGLQILASERHPSAMGLGKPKEGFSLFGLANRCVTQMGKRLLRMWFLRPLVNLDIIRDRQLPDMSSLLQRLALSQQRPDLRALQQLESCLRQLLRLRVAFEQELLPEPEPGAVGVATPVSSGRRPGGGAATHGSVQGAAAAAAADGAAAAGGPRWGSVSISAKVLDHVGPELQTALDTLLSILDMNQADDGMVIAEGVCPELDQLKATFRALPDFLTQVVETELRRVPRYLVRQNSRQLWTVIYLPQVGFVMRVQGQQLTADVLDALSDYELAFEGVVGPEEEGGSWAASELGGGGSAGGGGGSVTHGSVAAASTSTSTGNNANWAAYYRTQATNDLNARFGDLQYRIRDLEATLIAEMLRRLLRHFAPRLQRAAAVVAELDCLVALAALAADGGPGGSPYCRPQLTTENVLYIVNGRHPLAETVVDTYIPFTTHMRPHSGRLQVVTGPNASGKSCYARAVALIVFLAHLGAYVPADSARVGLADRIAARSAASALPGGLVGALVAGGGSGGGDGGGGGGGGGRGLVRPSTFMADLAQVSAMLRTATSRSLLILDEFGKGTLASDGVGLTAALLNHFSTGIIDLEPTTSAAAAAAAAAAASGFAPAASDALASCLDDTDTDPRVAARRRAPAEAPPRLILCTHFHELFRPTILTPSPQLVFLQMEVLSGGGRGGGTGGGSGAGGGAQQGREPQQQQQQQQHARNQQQQPRQQQAEVEVEAADDEEHVFLYRLVSGQCSSSFGVHCARLAGVDEAVRQRAREIISALQSGGVVGRSPRVMSSPLVLNDMRRLRQLQASSALAPPQRDAALRSLLQREADEAEAAAAASTL
ncbi:MutS protein msh5 [Pleodorina starrii]|nr:MutS protein msh5 [Pleodorina starrii]